VEINACSFIRTPSPVFTGKSVLLFAQCRIAISETPLSADVGAVAVNVSTPDDVWRLGDDFRQCRMVMKRSLDGGRSWGPMQYISEMSTGVGAALFDRSTNTVILQYQRMPNANPYQRNTLLQVTSADDGATWSTPRDITSYLAACNSDPDDMVCGGAGSRIQSASGRYVFAGHEGGHTVCVWYSDDRGETYKTSTSRMVGNEISVTEVLPGTLYMNGRNGGHPKWAANRSAWWSKDDGSTWSNAISTPLIDVNCEGAVITINVKGRPVMFFSEPHGPGRVSFRIHCSLDEGITWPNYIQVRFTSPDPDPDLDISLALALSLARSPPLPPPLAYISSLRGDHHGVNSVRAFTGITYDVCRR